MNLLPCRHRRPQRCYFHRGLDTGTADAHTFRYPALAECLGRHGRNDRHAPPEFIVAFHQMADRTPAGRDRRYRGRKPAGRGRVDRSRMGAPEARVAAFLTFFETTEARLANVGIRPALSRVVSKDDAACKNYQISSPDQNRWAGCWSSVRFVFSAAWQRTRRISIRASRAHACSPIAAPRVIGASAASPRDASASRSSCS